LGIWVTSEKTFSELITKFNIKDGILKIAGDTCDGISFDEIAKVI